MNAPGDSTKTEPFFFEISFWKPLVFGGYTQVREWNYVGPKYHLNEDLGLNCLEAIDFTFDFPVGQNNNVSISLGRCFFQGHQLLTENGYYNGTELTANTVASVDASRYIRLMLLDYWTLSKSDKEMFQLVLGISLDAIRFIVDAPYTESTPRKETFEQFDRQVVPVPIIGIKWNKYINSETVFHTEVKGGAWPGINTWYDEAGTIKIWQYNFETDVGVKKRFGDIESELNFKYRLISIKGESNEDTNEILIHGLGPELKVSYCF
jgi:hypothetical protein